MLRQAKSIWRQAQLRHWQLQMMIVIPKLPNTPTLKERGINMSFALERGVVAPKGTPKEIIDMWAGIIKQAVDNPSLQKAMAAKGTGLRYQGPAEFTAYSKDLYDAYEAVAIEIGMYKK